MEMLIIEIEVLPVLCPNTSSYQSDPSYIVKSKNVVTAYYNVIPLHHFHLSPDTPTYIHYLSIHHQLHA
jgi:hypothetical protein